MLTILGCTHYSIEITCSVVVYCSWTNCTLWSWNPCTICKELNIFRMTFTNNSICREECFVYVFDWILNKFYNSYSNTVVVATFENYLQNTCSDRIVILVWRPISEIPSPMIHAVHTLLLFTFDILHSLY